MSCEICNDPGDVKIDFQDEDSGEFCQTHAPKVIQKEIIRNGVRFVDLEVEEPDDD